MRIYKTPEYVVQGFKQRFRYMPEDREFWSFQDGLTVLHGAVSEAQAMFIAESLSPLKELTIHV